MACELPSWLDENFLTVALQSGKDQDPALNVTKFSATLAVAAGDNYLSHLYRVHVDYQSHGKAASTSFIVKAPLTKGVIYDMNEHFDFYGKETKMYQEFLPRINSLLGCEIGPKSFYCAVPRALILSDLKEECYEMCDRFTQLDFSHCEQVLKKLAKYHAGSVACNKDWPELIQTVGKEVFFIESDKFSTDIRPWIQSNITIVSGIVNESIVSSEVVETLERCAATVVDSVVSLCKPKKSGLNVLNHGDLWCNNILFKHSSSGTVIDVKFLDFQVARYVAPVVDILYFIWSSADENVRESRISELCEIYRQELNSTLERLNCEERLTEEELREDLRNALDWGVYVVTNVLPIIFCEPEDVVDLESVNVEDVYGPGPDKLTKFKRLFSGKQFRESAPVMVRQMLAWTSTL